MLLTSCSFSLSDRFLYKTTGEMLSLTLKRVLMAFL